MKEHVKKWRENPQWCVGFAWATNPIGYMERLASIDPDNENFNHFHAPESAMDQTGAIYITKDENGNLFEKGRGEQFTEMTPTNEKELRERLEYVISVTPPQFL